MGRVDKGIECSVSRCHSDAARSLSTEKAESAGLTVKTGEKRAYLCKEHYKEFKKKTKKDKQVDKWRHGV